MIEIRYIYYHFPQSHDLIFEKNNDAPLALRGPLQWRQNRMIWELYFQIQTETRPKQKNHNSQLITHKPIIITHSYTKLPRPRPRLEYHGEADDTFEGMEDGRVSAHDLKIAKQSIAAIHTLTSLRTA